jgi:hypothetical protein
MGITGFKEFFYKEENPVGGTGLMSHRPISDAPQNTTPQIQGNNPGVVEKAFNVISKLFLAGFGGAQVQYLIDAGKTLLKMGFGGSSWTSPGGVLKGIGKMAMPPIVYMAASKLGMPVPALIALITSPQFWAAYQGIGRMRDTAGLSGFVPRETVEEFVLRLGSQRLYESYLLILEA